MRAAIYARFSSDLQDVRSIVDQVELARRYADGRGLSVVEVYDDAAVSGASTLNRPGLLRLIADAQGRRFDVIITESLDRLSRSQADIALLFEKLQFLGVRIETLADGAVSEIHVGLKGTMSALFLKDLAQKTRRGQIGRVKAGRIPGGKSYGYDVLKDGDDRGRRAINSAEADIIRRIFGEYATGKGPLAIVRDLNREGVPGPTGRHWNASALLGSPERRNGILNNELYVGQIVYNRQRFLKDPATGKRISRENPEREWHRQPVAELRVIDDPTWEAVQRRPAERGGPHLYQQRRPQRPLSGLIYCGACGAKFIVATHDYLRCSARSNRGTCDTSRTLLMGEVEQRVLLALRNYLLSPDVVASGVEAYQAERKRLSEERRRSRHKLEAAAAEVERKISRLLTLVENGHADPIATGPRINELVAERKRLAEALKQQPASNVVEFFPKAVERYRQKVADIHAALSRGEEGDREAVALVRSLIGRIVVHATPAPQPLGLEVEGTLAALMTDAPELEHSGISCCMPPQPALSCLPGRGARQDAVRAAGVTSAWVWGPHASLPVRRGIGAYPAPPWSSWAALGRRRAGVRHFNDMERDRRAVGRDRQDGSETHAQSC
jgi:DNA invertase Pin-like site-specific DNA recombinase